MKQKCQYRGCKKVAEIGYYCWCHNPYSGMNIQEEQEKFDRHYKKGVANGNRSKRD